MPAAGERLQDPASLGAASAAQLTEHHVARDSLHDFSRMPTNQPLVGARQPILRKFGDHFEKLGADGVIEIFGRQFFLAGLGKSVPDVSGEFASRSRYNHACSHKPPLFWPTARTAESRVHV